MANITYTVKKGDTLSQLAVKYNTTVSELVRLNNIKDPDYIVVGQVLIMSGDPSSVTKNTSSKAKILVFGVQSNTDRTMYATWSWDKDNTDKYSVIWYYDTGEKDSKDKTVWFEGTKTDVTVKQHIYTAPSNAKQVKFKVKPIAKKRKVNGKDTAYWTASWSTEQKYDFADNPPSRPSVPTVKIEGFTLTAEINNIMEDTSSIKFEVVKDNTTIFSTGTATVKTKYASYSCTVDAGGEYKVRACGLRDDKVSDWSDYSSNLATIPSTPTSIKTCKAQSETSVYLEWESVRTAETYDIEYSNKKEYFDGSDSTQTVTGIETTHYTKTGLESGSEYFFRVRAVNKQGHSGWTDIKSTIIGKKPAAPTTWSSTTTVITGEPLTLYWVHNSEDNSSQTFAEVEVIIDGLKETYTVKNDTTNEDEKDKTSSYVIDTKGFTEGSTIQWRVRTAGITKVYGDWSIQRTVDIYAPVTLVFNMTDVNGNHIERLESFPFYFSGLAGPNTQIPIGYYLTISANEAYETIDQLGNVKNVGKNEQIYSKYFDTNDPLAVELSANHVDLENNIEYTATCVVSMNSGLTATKTIEFVVAWTDEQYEPNAEISIDYDTLTASIRPYCEDENEELIEGVFLAVYRREFDGTFVELANNLDNLKNTFITDPHPALDFARYRVVAITRATGAVSYCDIAGVPVGEKSAIIQWEEEWEPFTALNADEMEEPVWSGSILKLPYNVDISDNFDGDVSLAKYIGRKHPVSYYGTQIGSSSSWNVSIPKEDAETLYGLRRLANWMGDVYVREPSGSGYWASISVSFSQKHCDLTIPVSIDVTRVEGGV